LRLHGLAEHSLVGKKAMDTGQSFKDLLGSMFDPKAISVMKRMKVMIGIKSGLAWFIPKKRYGKQRETVSIKHCLSLFTLSLVQHLVSHRKTL
jgi:hypothetical protein